MAWNLHQRCFISANLYVLCFITYTLGKFVTFEKTFLEGISTKPFLRKWTTNNVEHCALTCAGLSECKSFSVQPSLQECSLYSRKITAVDILPASSSEQGTFFWKRHGVCPMEKGYSSVRGANKCLRLQEEPQTWTQAEVTCEAEGGHLAIIEDLTTWGAVRAFLEETGTSVDIIYVGGVKNSTGQWVWLDGRAVEENLWYPGEPNYYNGNDSCNALWWRGRVNAFSLLADDIPSWNLPFICEF